ncbi:MAG: hypothetical protein MZV65_53560 [Chromatiales bacterium]|nr:hypothetical protein [Chromatiales bacterium]
MFFGSAYGWWLTEQFNSNPAGENSDANVFGLQAGMKFPLLGGETRARGALLRLRRLRRQFAALRQQCERQYDVPRRHQHDEPADLRLRDPAAVGARWARRCSTCRSTFWADYAQNMAVGRRVRHRVRRRRDARQGQQRQDLGGGAVLPVDRQGRAVRAVRRLGLRRRHDRLPRAGCSRAAMRGSRTSPSTRTYFINTLNKDVGTELDYNRLQLDVNYKF